MAKQSAEELPWTLGDGIALQVENRAHTIQKGFVISNDVLMLDRSQKSDLIYSVSALQR